MHKKLKIYKNEFELCNFAHIMMFQNAFLKIPTTKLASNHLIQVKICIIFA